MTPPPPPPVVVGGSPFTPLARKGGILCGAGRALAHHHAGCRIGQTARVRVCACNSMRLCVYVYINHLFGFCGPRPARGDRSDPATFRFLGQVKSGGVGGGKEIASEVVIIDSELDLFREQQYSCEWVRAKIAHIATGARKLMSLFLFSFLSWSTMRDVRVRGSWEFGRSVGQADGADGVDGRAMPGPRSWMAFIGADTQSGQINFTARRNNVIGGVRLEMSA
jgi:hypothetical protein